VVGGPAAAEHRVQLLAGFLPSSEPVHGVGGDALGGMDGAGVAEARGSVDVVGRQSDRAVAAVVYDGESAVVGHCGNRPAVAVLNPLVSGQAEPSVVPAGDDHISDTGPISVRQGHLAANRVTAEAMITGLSVEFGDKLSGGGRP
jgi:hypothetical protein